MMEARAVTKLIYGEIHADIVSRCEESVGARVVGGGVPVDTPDETGTYKDGFTDLRKFECRVQDSPTVFSIDVFDHVLVARGLTPEKCTGGGIKRPDDPGLAWNTGHNLASIPRCDGIVLPFDVAR